MNRKKELLAQFRSMNRPMGLYQIRHRASGRVYVGRAVNLEGILNSVRLQLATGSFGCQELQADYRTGGEGAFAIETLEILPPNPNPEVRPEDELKELEALAKERLRDRGAPGYNF